MDDGECGKRQTITGRGEELGRGSEGVPLTGTWVQVVSHLPFPHAKKQHCPISFTKCGRVCRNQRRSSPAWPHAPRTGAELACTAAHAKDEAELGHTEGRARSHRGQPHSSSSPPPQAGAGKLGHALLPPLLHQTSPAPSPRSLPCAPHTRVQHPFAIILGAS